jgi:hypothetical protein
MRWPIALLLLLTARAQAAAPKYLVFVRGVDEAPGVSSGITEDAKRLLVDELKRHPEFTLDPPAGLPEEPKAMSQALKSHGLRAFEVTLKLQQVSAAVNPPPPGKPFRVLTRMIRLSIVGNTLPDKVLAIGGDGDSEIGVEIGRSADTDKEGRKLLLECTKAAVAQAVDMTLSKLKAAEAGAKKKP